jgi:hypothetical protein
MPTGTATKLGVFGASNHGVRTQFGWKTRVVLVGLNLIYLQFLWSKSCSWSIHVTYKKIYMVLEIRSKGLNLNHSFIILYLDPYLVLQTVPAWAFASFLYLQTALAI